ncbi:MULTISPECIES: hypothetical protein [Clostridia]
MQIAGMLFQVHSSIKE